MRNSLSQELERERERSHGLGSPCAWTIITAKCKLHPPRLYCAYVCVASTIYIALIFLVEDSTLSVNGDRKSK